jgi:hypothetical protein
LYAEDILNLLWPEDKKPFAEIRKEPRSTAPDKKWVGNDWLLTVGIRIYGKNDLNPERIHTDGQVIPRVLLSWSKPKTIFLPYATPENYNIKAFFTPYDLYSTMSVMSRQEHRDSRHQSWKWHEIYHTEPAPAQKYDALSGEEIIGLEENQMESDDDIRVIIVFDIVETHQVGTRWIVNTREY